MSTIPSNKGMVVISLVAVCLATGFLVAKRLENNKAESISMNKRMDNYERRLSHVESHVEEQLSQKSVFWLMVQKVLTVAVGKIILIIYGGE